MKRTNMLRLAKYLFVKNTNGPIQLIHFVTSKCNARCMHCFYWKNLNKNKDLTLEEITKISKTLPNLYFLLISGGEPFTRNDFAELIRAYYANSPVAEVYIPTNGILTDKIKKDCETILKNCPDLNVNINISLDGFSEMHNKIRGVPGCYEKATRTFFELKKLKKQYPNLKLSVISTLFSINQRQMPEFYRHVMENLKPDAYTINLVRSTPRNAELKDVDMDYFREILKLEEGQLRKYAGIRDGLRNFMYKLRIRMIMDTIEHKKFITPCYAAKLAGVLSEDGKIYPCELLSKPIGTIQEFDYDFRKVWKSGQIMECRNFINKTKCFCTHECFIRLNILFNPLFLMKNLLKIPAVRIFAFKNKIHKKSHKK